MAVNPMDVTRFTRPGSLEKTLLGSLGKTLLGSPGKTLLGSPGKTLLGSPGKTLSALDIQTDWAEDTRKKISPHHPAHSGDPSISAKRLR